MIYLSFYAIIIIVIKLTMEENVMLEWILPLTIVVVVAIAIIIIVLVIKKKGAKTHQIIKFEQNLCNAKVDDNEVLFVRVNDVVTDPKALFEVPITHSALLIKSGGNIKAYDSGTYNVFENEGEIKNWKAGMSVEVVYIPKDTRVLIKWGTPNRLRYRDEVSGKVITVGARGEFDVSVVNPDIFFRKVVGAKKEFDLEEFKKRYRETVATEFADIFLKTVDEKHLTYDKFAANKKEIAQAIGEILSVQFEKDWGLSVLNFKIADIDLLDEDMQAVESVAHEKASTQRLKEYLAELERLSDKEWEKQKYLRNLELQDKAAYYEVLKIIGISAGTKEKLICPNCNGEYSLADKFCPHCGKYLSTEPLKCPECGTLNKHTATFCSNCGKKLFK